MSLQHIKIAVDHDDFIKGDVVIVKRTYVDPRATAGRQMQTLCTRCHKLFPTTFRRMSGPQGGRWCEVRNVPQCLACRSRYRKEKVAALPLLEQWSVAGNRVLGTISGDARFPDGSLVTTSPIVKGPRDGLVTTQAGTVYALGAEAVLS